MVVSPFSVPLFFLHARRRTLGCWTTEWCLSEGQVHRNLFLLLWNNWKRLYTKETFIVYWFLWVESLKSEMLRGCTLDLVTVFDAILTSRQTRKKLQYLYENLTSNNFRRTAVLKKIWFVNWSFTPKYSILEKIESVTCSGRPRTTFLNFLYICL